MKILQISKLYHPWIGGVEKVVQDITEGLSKDFEFEVLACDQKGKGSRTKINGIPVQKMASLGIFWGMPVSPLFPLVLRKKARGFDALHFHLPFPLATMAFVKKPPQKIVVTYHSDIIRQKLPFVFYRPFLIRFLNMVDKIAVTSPKIVEDSKVLRLFKKKIVVIPLGIDEKKFAPSKDTFLRAEKIRKQYPGPLLLFVGRLSYYKGLEHLLEAMRHISARLLIIGGNGKERELKGLAKELSLEKKVFFLGAKQNKDIVPYYYAADIFVYPSTYETEAFGIAQTEAMICGLPVINTNLKSGVPWVSRHNETGLTVQPRNSHQLAQAIKNLLRDEKLRNKFGRAARARALKKFTLQRMLSSYRELYQKL